MNRLSSVSSIVPAIRPTALSKKPNKQTIIERDTLQSVYPTLSELDQEALSRHAVLFRGATTLTLPSGIKVALRSHGLKGGGRQEELLAELDQLARDSKKPDGQPQTHLQYFMSLEKVRSLNENQLGQVKKYLLNPRGCSLVDLMKEFIQDNDTIDEFEFEIRQGGHSDLNTLVSQIVTNLPPKKTICDLLKDDTLKEKVKGKFFWVESGAVASRSSGTAPSWGSHSKTGVIREVSEKSDTQYQLVFEDDSSVTLCLNNGRTAVTSFSYTTTQKKSLLNIFRSGAKDLVELNKTIVSFKSLGDRLVGFLEENKGYSLSIPPSDKAPKENTWSFKKKFSDWSGTSKKRQSDCLVFETRDPQKTRVSLKLYDDLSVSIAIEANGKKSSKTKIPADKTRALLDTTICFETPSDGEVPIPASTFTKYIGIDMDFVSDITLLDELRSSLSVRNKLIQGLMEDDLLRYWDSGSRSFNGLPETINKRINDHFTSLRLLSEEDKANEREKLVMDVMYRKCISADQFELMNNLVPMFAQAYRHADELRGTASICVIGGTGSGKSTFVNFAMGLKMMTGDRYGVPNMTVAPQKSQNLSKSMSQAHLDWIRTPEYTALTTREKMDSLTRFNLDPDQAVAIGYSAVSKTVCVQPVAILTPESNPALMAENLRIIDCPGFSDTRGSEYEVVTNLSIDGIFAPENNVDIRAIVIVLQHEEFYVNRGGPFIDRMEDLKGRFKDFLNPDNPNDPYFHFLINKTRPGCTLEDFQADIRRRCDELRGKEGSGAKKRGEIYSYIMRLLHEGRVTILNLADQHQRKNLLSTFFKCKRSPFKVSEYCGSFSIGNAANLGNVATAITEWDTNLCRTFENAFHIYRHKQAQIEEKSEVIANGKRAIIALQEAIPNIESQVKEKEKELAKCLDPQYELAVSKSNEIEKEVSEKYSALNKDQEGMLTGYRDQLQHIEEDIATLETKIATQHQQIDELNKEQFVLKTYIDDKSNKSEETKLSNREFTPDESVTYSTWKEGTLEKLLIENRNVAEADKVPGSEKTVRIGSFTGVLIYSHTIDRMYAVLPTDTDLRDLKDDGNKGHKTLTKDGSGENYGQYKIDIHMYRATLVAAKLCESDNQKVTYQYEMAFKAGEPLPYFRVVHTLPTDQIYKSQINENRIKMKHNADEITRLKLDIKTLEDNQSNKAKELERLNQKIDGIQIEMSQQKDQETRQLKKSAVQKLIHATEKELENLKRKRQDVTEEIAQHEINITLSEEEIKKIESDINTLKRETVALARLMLYKWDDLQGLVKISKKMIEYGHGSAVVEYAHEDGSQEKSDKEKLRHFVYHYEDGDRKPGRALKEKLAQYVGESQYRRDSFLTPPLPSPKGEGE